MTHYWTDNVHTTSFTPRDFQVELLASALEKNIIVCVGQKSSKEFIALKLIQELAPEIRQGNITEKQNKKQWTVYVTSRNAESTYNLVHHLTDLTVYLNKTDKDKATNYLYDNDFIFNDYQVLILSPKEFLNGLELDRIQIPLINLLIAEDCHDIENQKFLFQIFGKFYSKCPNISKPKVLCLAGPLHSAGCQPSDLKATLELFENKLHCEAETASDIVTVLRYCSKPSEIILECAPPKYEDLVIILKEMISTKKEFLKDHRYDPSEIYSDEFLEELQGIPDPKIDPVRFLETYLDVLNEMGPWCADRLALTLLTQIEKQKVKTPYERHFLLLCLVATTFVEIRAYCEHTFLKITNEKERVEKYSSPKVLRLLEILRCFKPEAQKTENKELEHIINDLDDLNFKKLSNTLEGVSNGLEKSEQPEVVNIIENLVNIIGDKNSVTQKKTDVKENVKNQSVETSNSKLIRLEKPQKSNNRNKKKFNSNNENSGYHRHRNRDNQNDPDALCGIIFCNSKNTAKVLFDLLCEMSKHDPDLGFLCVQYTVDRVADPINEPKEAEIEHRRQEEVLKRFRMHDCNLLIGTSVLEEGIDLPKCNLVIRWDPPTTYRSYVQCKGRARASQAYHIILVSPSKKLGMISDLVDGEEYNPEKEMLSSFSHKILCQDLENIEDATTENSSSKDKAKTEKTKSELTIIDESLNKIPNVDAIKTNEIENDKLKTSNGCDNTNLNETSDKDFDIISKDMEKMVLSSNEGNSHEENRKEKKHRFNDLEIAVFPLKEVMEIFPVDPIYSEEPNSNCVHNTNCTYEELLQNVSKIKIGKPKFQNKIDLKSKSNENSSTENSPTHKCLVDIDLNEVIRIKQNSSTNCTNIAMNFVIDRLAEYKEIEKILLFKCANGEPSTEHHIEAEKFSNCIEPYKPLKDILTSASVDMSSAISLVNRYCAKLPSDTFTKLTPLWRKTKTNRNGIDLFQYTIRLPINSPLKYDIVGVPMPTDILARRAAALLTCRELHKYGELDDNLQPIGKEGFRASEPDWENFELEASDELIVLENSEPRPGTTKRRQYYYKRIANEFSNCRPIAGEAAFLYFIDLTLQCPIPEEQNTRGRKIYPPEDAQQGFGILTLKRIPKVSSFPIFTRSGEVKVSLKLSQEPIILNQEQVKKINIFLNYTFTNVLRLQKFLMLFDSDATENSIFIVPTVKSTDHPQGIIIDWQFLDVICENCDKMPTAVPESERAGKEFDANRFKDAVVMPWYRNQDQPQYFYVAEICYHLSPESCFPGQNYKTFQEYYFRKYNINIQNSKQPLLDVDHTSARLNFLTPRYVNRKGVALPTSSEETKRAKRENLEQKQILVPELCTIHPFPASLWRAAVCLPCILYRINGLLLADEIRKKVSRDLGLGRQEIYDDDFEWPMLDFGWSLAEVLKKSRMKAAIEEEIKAAAEKKTKEDLKLENKDEDKSSDKKTEDENNDKDNDKTEKTVNDILEEAHEKMKADNFVEIGTWSNDMANNINNDTDFEDDWGLLPSNINLCSTKNTNIRYGSPTSWDYLGENHNKGNINYSDSDASYQTDEEFDMRSMISYSNVGGFNNDDDDDDDDNQQAGLRIEFKSNNVAEAIETEEQILKREKKLAILQETNENEKNYQLMKNREIGFELDQHEMDLFYLSSTYLKSFAEFKKSVENFKDDICTSGVLKRYDEKFVLPKKENIQVINVDSNIININKLVPYIQMEKLQKYLKEKYIDVDFNNIRLQIDDIENLNNLYLEEEYGKLEEEFEIQGIGDIFDNFNDSIQIMRSTAHQRKIRIDFNNKHIQYTENGFKEPENLNSSHSNKLDLSFSFDYQPNLEGHPGPSPSVILQALTMSNANDGINLERLETIGDSFLKYAITSYLYCTYENVHEGKLSHLRSKQVSNLNLYRLGRRKVLGECMIATKFEPHDNWLPPCYYVPKELEKALIEARIPPCHWNLADLPNIKQLSSEEICELVKKKAESLGLLDDDVINEIPSPDIQAENNEVDDTGFTCFIPYNLVTQHSIPDKSIADCVEALIGAYLIECGPRGALLFMAWLGIRVLPMMKQKYDPSKPRIVGTTLPDENNEVYVYGEWIAPKSPLLKYAPCPYKQLNYLLDGFSKFEDNIGYHFQDRSYLLQAMTHASYSPNRLTDCYQRLEFLGDAVLDYLITRHLYEDPRQHSPGALTDLRSALVNNTIFASLAVRHGFHKYFRHLSPGLNDVIDRFVRIQHENGHVICEEYYLLSEEECDDAEDVEVPKALGDVFESVAGAIFLDSNMSLDMVWKVYYNMMKPEIEQFSNSVPKSPIRELLELEPETAKFGRPEKLADGRRVRVTVEVFGKGTYRGIGRNYRIAKCTAAKCALRQLKKQGLIGKKH